MEIWNTLTEEEQKILLEKPVDASYNYLTVGLLRQELISIMLNGGNEKDLAVLINALKTELVQPSERSYSDELAKEVNDEYNLDIDDTRTVVETYSLESYDINIDIEVFKSIAELENDYYKTLDELKKSNAPDMGNAIFKVTELYEGAIHNFQKKEEKKPSSTDLIATISNQIDSLHKAKENFPKKTKEIELLITKLAVVAASIIDGKEGDYLFDTLSKSERVLYETLLNEPYVRAQNNVDQTINEKDKEFFDKIHEDASKFASNQSEEFNLSMQEISTDYSQEKIDMSDFTIASKMNTIAIASGQRVSSEDPVFEAAFSQYLDAFKAEMDSYGKKKVAQLKVQYGDNWKDVYIEKYTKGWNAGINHAIEKSYEAGLKTREENIEKVEDEFSFGGAISEETMAGLAQMATGAEVHSEHEKGVQEALVNLQLGREAKNIEHFRNAQMRINLEGHVIVANLNKQEPDKKEAYLDSLSDLSKIAYYMESFRHDLAQESREVIINDLESLALNKDDEKKM